jgi:hypothetical protein
MKLKSMEGHLWKPQERILTERSGRRNWKASPSERRRELGDGGRKTEAPKEPGNDTVKSDRPNRRHRERPTT